jgi:2-keto-4-pentenoate hydratase
VLSDDDIQQAAREIFEAERTRVWIEPVSDRYDGAEIDDAYRIALAVAVLKQADGHTIKGHKVGLTSKAMRSISNATEPDYGFLYDDKFVLEGSTLSRSRLNQPRVEAEIAFVLDRPLSGPYVNAADVIRATDFIVPALEIVDSRFTRRGKSLLVDNVSDAAYCGGVVLGGRPMKLTDVDVRRMSAMLAINGDIMETGSAAAVMGNPINAVAWLANKLHEFGVGMEPGNVILSGSFLKAIPFDAGDSVSALYDQLGEVTFMVGE